jgi:hypothetical protein
MQCRDNSIEVSAAVDGSSGQCDNHRSATCSSKPCCFSRLAWPPDALTRLLMNADRVPEVVLDALLQRIAAARASG